MAATEVTWVLQTRCREAEGRWDAPGAAGSQELGTFTLKQIGRTTSAF